jgi:hypothetical protein
MVVNGTKDPVPTDTAKTLKTLSQLATAKIRTKRVQLFNAYLLACSDPAPEER